MANRNNRHEIARNGQNAVLRVEVRSRRYELTLSLDLRSRRTIALATVMTTCCIFVTALVTWAVPR
jgi:hypothetical protein